MPDLATIGAFLDHDRIVFVGASRQRSFANDVYRTMRANGHELVPVNRAIEPGGTIEGDPAFASLADVPRPIAPVFVLVPPEEAVHVARDAVDAGVGSIWFHHGVGRGSGTPEAIALCRAAGMAVVERACPLMYDVPVRGVHRVHRALARLAPGQG